MNNIYSKRTLTSGVKVVMERMSHVRSVCVGIWVCSGSRNETASLGGISHFLEHMFFKGTKKRTARDIAVDMDSLGGEINAFTGKEGTTYYIKVLDEYLERGVEVLSDIFINSTFAEDEIEREKSVIREEIGMVEDTPDEYVHDIFSESIWDGGGLGQPVLGTIETVNSITRDDLLDYVRVNYGAQNIIVSCAGSFDEDELMRLLEKYLGGVNGRAVGRMEPGAGRYVPARKTVKKELSEVHVCMAVPGISQQSEERYVALLANTVLGGGTSSRLFQEIRENRGLSYSVFSYLSSYYETGVWALYAGTAKSHLAEVLDICTRELIGLNDSLTVDDLERAKRQVKGSVMLGLESTSRRMQNIASQEIYYGRNISPEETMRRIDEVSLADARDFCSRHAGVKDDISLVVLGPVGKKDFSAMVRQTLQTADTVDKITSSRRGGREA